MLRPFGFIVGALSLSVVSGSALADEKLTYGTYLPPTHVINTAGIVPFVKRLSDDSKGQIQVELFTGGSVAKGTAAIDSVRDGLVTSGLVVDTYVSKQLPHSYVGTDLAVLGRNSVAMSGAASEYNLVKCEECLADQKKQGIIQMSMYSTAPYTLMCRNDLRSMDDLKGKKIRSAGAWSIMFKNFGMVPVNITSDETYEALQRGQVDCSLGADAWLKSYTLWDVAKNVLEMQIGTYHGGSAWVMNAEVWNKLLPGYKAIIKKNMPLLTADLTFAYLEESRDVRATATAKGVKFHKPDPSFTKAYDDYALKEVDRVKEEATKRGIKDAGRLVDAFLELVAKWQKIDDEEVKGDRAKFAAALDREVYAKVKW